MTIKIRLSKAALMFHSDRGAQYICGLLSRLPSKYKTAPSMSNVGAYLDNAVVEYIGYYNHE